MLNRAGMTQILHVDACENVPSATRCEVAYPESPSRVRLSVDAGPNLASYSFKADSICCVISDKLFNFLDSPSVKWDHTTYLLEL